MESLGAFLDGEWESICKMFTTDEVEPDFTMELLLGHDHHHHHHQSLTSGGVSNITTNPEANPTPTTAFTTASIFDHLGFGVNFGSSEAFNTNIHDGYFSPSRQGNTSTTTTTSSGHSGGGGGSSSAASLILPASARSDGRRYPLENQYGGYDQIQDGGLHMTASSLASSMYDLQNMMMDYEVVMMDPTNHNKSSASSSNHIIHPAVNNNNAGDDDDDDHSPPSSSTNTGLETEEKNTLLPVAVPKKRGRVTKDGQKGKKKRKQSCAAPSGGGDLQEEEENKSNMNGGGGGVANDKNHHPNSCDVQMNSDNESNVSDEANGEENDDSKEIVAAAVKKRASRGAATDPQSLYARRRRERINERLRILQNLVPNGTKVDISTMLEEAVHYVKFLQLQIKLLSSDEMWMYAPLAYNGVDVSLHRKFSPFLL